MLKKNLLNLFLLLLVAGLTSFVYFSENEDASLETLSPISIDAIHSIVIQRKDSHVVISKTSQGTWEIKKPITIPANDFRVATLLKLINSPVYNTYSTNEISLKPIGLFKPDTTVTFNDTKISFGIINPATRLRYVQIDDKVYTIEDVYFPLISSHFSSLVSLNLLPKGSKVSKLILSNQTISKDDKGLWRSNTASSADLVAKTIDHWQTIQAFGVHTYLERKTLGEVFIYTNNTDEPTTYIITDKEPWLIIARPEIGLEYHLDVEAYNKLIRPK